MATIPLSEWLLNRDPKHEKADHFRDVVRKTCRKAHGDGPDAGEFRKFLEIHDVDCEGDDWKHPAQPSNPHAARRPTVSGVGDHFLKILKSLGVTIPGCEGCQGSKNRMNHEGVTGCKKKRDEFLAELRKRAKSITLSQWAMAAWNALLNGLAFKVNPLDPIPGLFDEAIRRASIAYVLVPICYDQQATGVLVDLAPSNDPLGLAWFVWPRTETRELWLEQQSVIRAAMPLFDGPKRLYIATGDTSEGELDPHGWDEIKVAPNDPQGREVPGWRWLMDRAATDPGATVFLHSKGVLRGCYEPHLTQWWKLAYQTMLDVERVRAALDRSLIAGCFRRNLDAVNLGVPWHFSGTFYAVRNDAITFPESKAGGWYAEAWPALIASRELATCIRFDGCGDLYQAKNWKEEPA